MKQRGVNDDLNIEKIKRLMAEKPEMSRRAAIIAVAGHGNERRIEIKMTAREKLIVAAKAEERKREKSLVAAAHAGNWPVSIEELDGGISAKLIFPSPNGEKAHAWLDVTNCGWRGEGIHLRGMCWLAGGRQYEEGDSHRSHLQLVLEIFAFGKPDLEDGSRVVPFVVNLLAEHLVEAWRNAGLTDADDIATAKDIEWARLRKCAVSRLDEIVGAEARRVLIAACMAGCDGKFFLEQLSYGLTEARIAAFSPLASFMCHQMLFTRDRDIKEYKGHPAALLASVINRRIGYNEPTGKEVSTVEAEWLISLFDERFVPPISLDVLITLLRRKSSIDAARITSSKDAIGLTTLVGAVVGELNFRFNPEYYDKDIDLLFARLNSGIDASRTYGEVAERMDGLAEEIAQSEDRQGVDDWRLRTPMAEAVHMATFGVENLRRHAIMELVVPIIVGGCDEKSWRRADVLASAMADRIGFEMDGLMTLSFEMVCSGRDMADMARAAMLSDADHNGRRSELLPRRWEVEKAAVELVGDRLEIDVAGRWARIAPHLSPLWRDNGIDTIACRYHSVAENADWQVVEAVEKMLTTRIATMARVTVETMRELASWRPTFAWKTRAHQGDQGEEWQDDESETILDEDHDWQPGIATVVPDTGGMATTV